MKRGTGSTATLTGGWKSPLADSQNIFALIVIFFSIALYANSVFNDYNLDDELVTRNHPLTSQGISAIPEIFSSSYYTDNMGYSYEYRPVVLATFAIEHSLFGESPFVGHCINVLLYALLCWLIFHVLGLLLSGYSPLLPFVIVLLFAAHPVHTEVVNSIKNRDEILSLLFGLLTLYFSIAGARKSWYYLVAAFAFFALSVLSKASSVPFILIIPLAIITFTQSGFWVPLVLIAGFSLIAFLFGKIPFLGYWLGILIGSAAFAGMYYVAMRNFPVIDFLKQTSLLNKLKARKARVIPTAEKKKIAEHKSGSLFLVIVSVLIGLLSLFCGIYHFLWFNILLLCALLLLQHLIKSELHAVPFVALVLSVLVQFYVLADPEPTLVRSLLFMVALRILLLREKTIVSRIYIALFLIVAIFDVWLFLDPVGVLLPCLALYLSGRANNKLRYAGLGIWSLLILSVLIELIVFCAEEDALYIVSRLTFCASGILFLLAFFKRINYKLYTVVGFLSLFIYFGMYKHALTPVGVWEYSKEKALLDALRNIGSQSVSDIIFRTESAMNEVSTGVKKGVYGLSKAGEIEAPQISSKNLDRPLDFAENPVLPSEPLNIRMGTSMTVLCHYYIQVFLCHPLAFYYGYAYIKPASLGATQSIIGFILSFALFLAALFLLKRNILSAFALFYFLLSILAFSNFIQPVPGVVADRLLFLPSLGFCMLIAVILLVVSKMPLRAPGLSFKNTPVVFRLVAFSLLALYSFLTVARNADWKDAVTLMRKDIKKVSNSAQAHNLLAAHLVGASFAEKNPEKVNVLRNEAIVHFKSAVAIYPGFYNAWFDLGKIYMAQNDYNAALSSFLQAYSLDSSNAEISLNIGAIYEHKGDINKALRYYVYTTKIAPQNINGHAFLYETLFNIGRMRESIAASEYAIRFHPLWKAPYENMIKAYTALGDTAKANAVMRQTPR